MRELTTKIILFAVGFLAGRTWRTRVRLLTVIAFGIWDIFYYYVPENDVQVVPIHNGLGHSVFTLPARGSGEPVVSPTVLISLLLIF